MAQVIGNALFGQANIEIPAGTNVVLIDPVDNGLSWFNARWTMPKAIVTGRLASTNLLFSPDEITSFALPIDAHGLPLFRDLRVRYVGQSDPAIVSNGDFLIVRDLWYNGVQLECQCVHLGNARPNTDGKVVVECNQLDRA